MRSFLVLISLFLPITPAFATSKQQIREGRAGCVKFFRLPKAEQIKAAKRAGYSYSQTLASCRLLVNQSVEKTYRDANSAPRKQKSKPAYKAPEPNRWNPPACAGSRDCGPGAHCNGGSCVDTAYGCGSNTNCGSFESCVDGVCK